MQELLTNKTIEKLKYDLVRDGLINYDDLSKAEETSETMSLNLAQVLIQTNLITEDSLLSFIEAKLHIPYVNLDDYILDKKCLHYITKNDAKKYRIIPLFKIEEVLTIAMADPLDLFFINTLK
jgi:type IV pilus assembly protein PilB